MFFVGAIKVIGRQTLSKHLSVDVGCLVWVAQLSSRYLWRHGEDYCRLRRNGKGGFLCVGNNREHGRSYAGANETGAPREVSPPLMGRRDV